MRIPPSLEFVLCTLIWGTTWLAIKIGYDGLDAVWGASLRFFLAAAILLPIVFARRVALPRGRRQLGVAVLVGLLLFGFEYGLIYWGEQRLASGVTAILFATMPLFVAVFASLLIPTERMTTTHFAGVALGLIGLVVIFLPDLQGGLGAIVPALAIVVGASGAAMASVLVRRWGRDLDPLALNGVSMLVGASVLLGGSLALGERPALPATGRSWGSLLYLVVLGSIVSFFLYWDLLKSWPAHRAGLVPIATPVVAVLSGYVFNAERLSLLQFLGSAIVILGVALSLLPTPVFKTQRTAPDG